MEIGKMKDKQTLLWLYKNSKSQLFPILLLVLGNALFAACAILFALASRDVIDAAAAGDKNVLIMQGLWLLAVILSQLMLRILSRSLEIRIQGKLELSYRRSLIGKLLTRDYAHTTKHHSGELMNRLTGDVSVVTGGSATILPEFAALFTRLFGAISVLYVFDPAFTLIFIAGGVLLLLTTKYFRERLKHLHKTMQEKDGVVRSFMQELLESLVVIKTFGAEREMESKTAGLGQEHYIAKIRKNTVTILANSGFYFVFSIGYLYALIWGAFGLMAATVSFGTMTAVLQLVGQVQMPFTGLSGLIPKLYGVIASAERLIELENMPDEADRNKEDIHMALVYSAMRSMRLKDVSFRYDRELVLHHTGLTIEKGDFAVIAGRSGIGKSTLIMLMLGIFAPANGVIGIELDTGEMIQMDKHTRKLFAYVPQNNLLLSGTIRENIAFINANASDERIMEAADISCAAEFICALPHGLDTVIGEKGLGLSQGQVQRLAIARAIACDAPILLLDEATSALDEATEKKLLHNIRQMTDKTCIIISHKKAVFELCNKEIRIENGRLKTRERSGCFTYDTA
jgi:ATP-binding cassette subfamily B protein